MENKLHIELLAKATDLTPDEIHADLIKPEYETPFQVISVHSTLTALQALETDLKPYYIIKHGKQEYVHPTVGNLAPVALTNY